MEIRNIFNIQLNVISRLSVLKFGIAEPELDEPRLPFAVGFALGVALSESSISSHLLEHCKGDGWVTAQLTKPKDHNIRQRRILPSTTLYA